MRFRLIVNGKALDLTEGQSLTFKFVNDVFGFDNIELSRTAEFSVPVTSNNQIIFDFASRTDYDGGAMRLYNDCLLQYAGGEIHGKLAVTAWEGGAYKCSFIYGEMSELQAIKKAGNIGEYLNFDSSYRLQLVDNPTPVTHAYDFAFPEYDNGQGVNLQGLRLPAVRLDTLLLRCGTYFGTDVSALSTPAQMYRIVNNTMNADGYVIDTRTVNYSYVRFSGFDPLYFQEVGMTISHGGGTTTGVYGIQATTAVSAKVVLTNTYTPGGGLLSRGLYQLRGVNIDTADDKLQSAIIKSVVSQSIEATFDMQVGDILVYLDYRETVSQYGRTWKIYTYPNIVTSMTLTEIGLADTCKVGGYYYLQPNLPSMTFIDLLKTVANLEAKALTYDSNTKTFGMFNYDFDAKAAAVLRIEDVLISVERVERTFGDWCQSNGVVYDSADFVTPQERGTTEAYYTVPNEVLEKSKALYTYKQSQPTVTAVSDILASRGVAQVPCTEWKEENGVNTLDLKAPRKAVLLYAGQTTPYEVAYIKRGKTNANLQGIASLSTKIKCKVHINEITFLAFQRYSRFTYNGDWWCLIEAEWSNGVATLTLQRYR